MTPERWQRVKELFEAALERAPVERPEFFREACGEDEALRAELESLLAEERVVGSFLSNDATKTMNASSWNIGAPAAKTLPSMIGHYRIVGFVGKGGMAVVYKAEQQEPRRIVALKVIKPGLVGPEYERRFEREKDALARLKHEGIARIYEAGTANSGSGPQPYFAMELIEQGRPLTEYAETKQLTTRQRLELMAQVCDAVHHAHQHFIIHRDLKPSNILVDEHGHAKVLDFGVARITDSDIGATRQTDIGQLVGTLEYMSPEQARGDPSQVDTRSDIYALGVVLYELLAGKLPYDLRDKPPLETLAIIPTQDPAKLGSISRQYHGDIETIAAKCLEKDKARRYSSAAELAADLRRHLSNEPITARPTSFGYQLQKFARRNKVAVGGAAAVFVVLVAGIIATSWQARVAIQERNTAKAAQAAAEDARKAAETQRNRAETALKGEAEQRQNAVEQARLATDNATQAEARQLLAWANASLGEDPERSLLLGLYSWDKSRTMAGGLEQLLHDAVVQWRGRLTIRGHQGGVKGGVNSVAWSPDGSKLATASQDRTAKVWDARTGRELLTLRANSPVQTVAWSPDGRKLATVSLGDTVSLGEATVWDSSTGRELLTSRANRGILQSVAWSPDGSKLATANLDRTAKVWEAGTGRELLTLRARGPVQSVAWSPDGTKLATASLVGTSNVWDASTGRELLMLTGGGSLSVAWSPNGSMLALARLDGTARIWDASAGVETLVVRAHQGFVAQVAWSPDGNALATAGSDQTAKVWVAGTGREVFTLRGHQGEVASVAWSPDGGRLATASADGTARVWDAAASSELLTLRGHRSFVRGVAWSPDGSKLATASLDRTAKVWEAGTGRELLTLRDSGPVQSVAWSPDGTKLATTTTGGSGLPNWNLDSTAKVWEATTGRELTSFGQFRGAIAWSPDGGRLVDVTAKLWSSPAGRELLTLRGALELRSIARSPDGGRLATANLQQAKIWDADTGRELLTLHGDSPLLSGGIAGIAWSPDGRKLATSNPYGAEVWEANTGLELLTLRRPQGVMNVAWSPDGRRLATANRDGTAELWEASTGRELLTLTGHQGPVNSVAWSPDGTKLATASDDTTVQVYAIDPVLLLRLVRSRITRELTPDECRRYLTTDHCPPLPRVP